MIYQQINHLQRIPQYKPVNFSKDSSKPQHVQPATSTVARHQQAKKEKSLLESYIYKGI